MIRTPPGTAGDDDRVKHSRAGRRTVGLDTDSDRHPGGGQYIDGAGGGGGLLRYRRAAGLYDALSAERRVYGAGRRAGIEMLRLRPGQHVVDVGCGTGLSLAALREGVLPGGLVTGVDSSAAMLRRARAKVARRGWDGVRLIRADAAAPSGPWADPPADAVLFCYSLSVMPNWREALRNAAAAARPGARIAVVDLAVPAGRWPSAMAARIACLAGGSNPDRRPWLAVGDIASHVEHRSLLAGHIHVAAGELSPG